MSIDQLKEMDRIDFGRTCVGDNIVLGSLPKGSKGFTIGRQYEVRAKESEWFKVKDDNGKDRDMHYSYFVCQIDS